MKDTLNELLIHQIAADLQRANPEFSVDPFTARASAGLDELELTGRAAHIAAAMHEFLPQSFAKTATILIATLGPEIPASGQMGLAALRYLPYSTFVQRYGSGDYDAAIALQAELTKRFTAEFSIRPFLERYPERTYSQMLAWARDDNAHLRRLASEGMRPRLPWAARLRQYQQDPRPVLAVLELLKDDPERYVQRSVANTLNDIAKDHPSLVLETCRHWVQDANQGRLWIVRHALRSLVKAGDREAIRILGGEETPLVRVVNAGVAPAIVAIGKSVHLFFQVESTAPAPQRLLIDYAVHFVRADGSKRPKVFKVRALTMQPKEKCAFRKTISFASMTTRQHYAGQHHVEVLINGFAHPVGAFAVVASSRTV